MISHEHRCIFVHIPRTAGTSIEEWILGSDFWKIEPESKHLLASQAKRLYAEYWDEYFKFSFVRNPVDRMISCLAFADHFGLKYSRKSGLSFDGYHEKYGTDIIIENDHRFSNRSELITEKHGRRSVYGNLLDEELDFIGRLENLEADILYIKRVIGKKEAFNCHFVKSKRKWYLPAIRANSVDRNYIEHLFKCDLERFSLAC